MIKLNLKKYKSISFLALLLCMTGGSLRAQETYTFKEGLIANMPHRYGREALYTDELAYQLYTNSLKTPVEAAVIAKDDKGQPVSWKKISADSLGRLRAGRGGGFGRGSSYIYL